MSRNIVQLNGLMGKPLYTTSEIIMCACSPSKYPDFVILGKYPGAELIKVVGQGGSSIQIQKVDNKILDALNDEILEITEDKNNNIWLSTYKNGLIKLEIQKNIDDIKIVRYDTSNGLPSNLLNFANRCGDDILVGTTNGIYKNYYNPNSNLSFSQLNSAPDKINSASYVYSLNNNILIFGIPGMRMFEKKSNNQLVLIKNELSKIIGSSNRISIQNNKEMLLPNDMGFGLFKYSFNNLNNTQADFKSAITGIEVGRNIINLHGLYYSGIKNAANEYFERSLIQPDDFPNKISKENNNIKFSFTALFYEQGDSILFSFKLEGFEKEWSSWSKGNKKEYTNIPAGDYVFKVKAKNIAKIESTISSFAFEILPAWYETIYAYVLYFLVFVLMIALIVKFYTKRLEKANLRLEKIVEERTKELIIANKKVAESARIAGRAEIATNILHNVGNVLNSMNVITEATRKKIAGLNTESLNKFNEMLQQNENNFEDFVLNSIQGKKIPGYINAINSHLRETKEKVAINIDELIKHIKHVTEIVRLQQQYSKVDGGKEILSVQEIIKDVVEMNSDLLQNANIILKIEQAEIPSLQLDRYKIIFILLNLIKNSIKALENVVRDDKTILITTQLTEDNKLSISVADNGIGIENENLNQIFNHGFTTHKNHQGFGLHSSANSASEMGGSLKVKSDGPEKGACFTLTIPVNIK